MVHTGINPRSSVSWCGDTKDNRAQHRIGLTSRKHLPQFSRSSTTAYCTRWYPTWPVLAGGGTCVIGYCVGTGGTPVGNAGKTPGANETAGGTMLGTP